MDRAQRRTMLLLPLFFGISIISFPAGLIVYWITTNAWTMGRAVGDPPANSAGGR